MQVMAVGKWSKPERTWKMVVAMHRPQKSASGEEQAAAKRPLPAGKSPVTRLSDRLGK